MAQMLFFLRKFLGTLTQFVFFRLAHIDIRFQLTSGQIEFLLLLFDLLQQFLVTSLFCGQRRSISFKSLTLRL